MENSWLNYRNPDASSEFSEQVCDQESLLLYCINRLGVAPSIRAVALLVMLGCGGHCGVNSSAQQSADCMANLRKLAAGIGTYAQDWDEVLPGTASQWADEIQFYV